MLHNFENAKNVIRKDLPTIDESEIEYMARGLIEFAERQGEPIDSAWHIYKKRNK